MKRILYIIVFLSFASSWSQVRKSMPTRDGVPPQTNEARSSTESTTNDEDVKATIDMYRFFTSHDTVYVDTSLHLKQAYKHNLLRRDIFGLFEYSNEGQMYQRLSRKSNLDTDVFPKMGFYAKFFNYYQVQDMQYFHVATPFSELYFKTVMQQGQNLDAIAAVNTSPRLNFSVAYKGLRSLGNYVNQLSSHGNFRFTTKYENTSGRYQLKAHVAGQDLRNQQNGGIISVDDFLLENPAFSNRARFDVYSRDAQTFLKGHRLFVNHHYRFLHHPTWGKLFITHQFQHEYVMHEYKQKTLETAIDQTEFFRYGEAYVRGDLRDQTRFSYFENKLGLMSSHKFGQSKLMIDHRNFDYFYDKVLILNEGTVPNGIFEDQTMLFLSHQMNWRKWQFAGELSRPLAGLSISSWKLEGRIPLTSHLFFKGTALEKVQAPDMQDRLLQSNFQSYNWFNSFNNIKSRVLQAELHYKDAWINAQWQQLTDYIFYENTATIQSDSRLQQLLVKPSQFTGQINHFSVEASKNIHWRKWNFDSRLLYQQVEQSQLIFNVPEWTLRHTLAYDTYFFKKALYVQTGVTANYFSRYFAEQHHSVLNVFFIQQQQLIGDFPVFDFFVNAKIKTFRAFLKFEHINAGMNGQRYLIDPNQPFRDRIFRFGLIWNFFQ